MPLTFSSNTHPSKPSRNRRRVRRRKPGDGIDWAKYSKIAAIVGVPVITLGAGAYFMTQSMKVERPDEIGCYNRSDRPVVAIAIDASLSSDLSAEQKRGYNGVFERAYAMAPPNSRVDFYTTARDTNSAIAKPVASACKPVSTKVENAALGVPDKPAPYLKKQAEDARHAFEKIARQMLSDVQSQNKSALDSPLFESMQSLSRSLEFQGSNRALWWITDGINNSEVTRACTVKGDLPSFSVFKTQRRYSYVAPETFAGTDVNIMLVEHTHLPHPSAPYCTNFEIREFWQHYFKANGAERVKLQILRHGAE